MSLFETIRTDFTQARKDRNAVKSKLLATLVGAIETKSKTLNPARMLTDAEVIAEIKKMLDSVIETGRHIATAEGRESQRADNAVERQVLEAYMPQQMTEADLEAFARDKQINGVTTLGGIMQALKTERGGAYDGKLASTVVKRVLG